MAYFDSPKNRAMWERELQGLRRERENRIINGYKPGNQGQQADSPRENENPFRRRITLAELEQREVQTLGRENGRGGRERTHVRERTLSREKAPAAMGPKAPFS